MEEPTMMIPASWWGRAFTTCKKEASVTTNMPWCFVFVCLCHDSRFFVAWLCGCGLVYIDSHLVSNRHTHAYTRTVRALRRKST